MIAWVLGALVIACVLVTLALFVRVEIHLSLQGRGEPNGSWALAGGASVGPLSLAGVGARGVPPTAHVHVFKRRVLTRAIAWKPKADEPEAEETPRIDRYRKLTRWLDPIDLLIFLLDETGRIRVSDLVVDVGYSFENIMLTSQVMGVLYVLESVLPAPFVLRQEPAWDFEDRAKLDGSAVIAFRPLLLLIDLSVFLIKNIRLRRPSMDAQAIGS